MPPWDDSVIVDLLEVFEEARLLETSSVNSNIETEIKGKTQLWLKRSGFEICEVDQHLSLEEFEHSNYFLHLHHDLRLSLIIAVKLCR